MPSLAPIFSFLWLNCVVYSLTHAQLCLANAPEKLAILTNTGCMHHMWREDYNTALEYAQQVGRCRTRETNFDKENGVGERLLCAMRTMQTPTPTPAPLCVAPVPFLFSDVVSLTGHGPAAPHVRSGGFGLHQSRVLLQPGERLRHGRDRVV